MNKRKILWVMSLLAFMSTISYVLALHYGRLSGFRIVLRQCGIYAKNYVDAYQKYDLSIISGEQGCQFLNPEVHFFGDEGSLTNELKTRIPESALPYMESHRFRILMIYSSLFSIRMEYMTIDERGAETSGRLFN